MDQVDPAKQMRARAKEIRDKADRMRDAACAQTMRDVAAIYESMAEQEEAYSRRWLAAGSLAKSG